MPFPSLPRSPVSAAVAGPLRPLALVAITFALVACADDESASRPVPPPGPPELRIETLTSAGHGTFDRSDLDCVPIGSDSAGTVVVGFGAARGNRVELVNWTFRPFQGCGNSPQCGLLAVRVTREGDAEPAFTQAATSALVPVPFGDPALGPGTYTIAGELIDDFGLPFVLDGGAFQDSVEVVIQSRCGAASDAGASSDAAGIRDGGETRDADASSDAADAGSAVEGGPQSIDGAPGTDASVEAGPSTDASLEAGADAEASDAAAEASDAAAEARGEAGSPTDAATGG